jgi:(p)ppGpp synthase/HD superfamily hydrolase
MELRHSKQLTFMRGMLDGKCYYKAWEAMEFAAVLEQGYRKDGKTPKFHHQLQVARLVATLLPHLTEPENTLAAAFLHDELEDNFTLVSRNLLEEKFGHEVASAVWKLSKKCGGLTKTKESLIGNVSYIETVPTFSKWGAMTAEDYRGFLVRQARRWADRL